MNGKDPEQEFIHALRHDFENSVQELDTDTLAALAAARRQALAGRTTSLRHRLLVPAGAFVLLCLVLIAYKNLPPRSATPPQGADEIELMIIQEGLDYYDDLEFYEWLEDQGFFS